MATSSTFAQIAARPIDRVHIAASTVPTREELHAIQGFDVSPGDAALVVAFLHSEPMTSAQLRLPLRYIPEDRLRARLDECAASGAITVDGDVIAYTPAGREAALAVLDARAVALQVMWSNSRAHVDHLLEVLGPVADAAMSSAQPSSGLERGTLRAPNPTAGSRLWRLIAIIRRYRADCHAQAWDEAGHTATSMVALAKDSPEREPIERRTNELNASIWDALAQDNQLACMAALASLDGSGTPT